MKVLISVAVALIFTECVDCYIVNPGPLYVATKGEIWPKPQDQVKSEDYFVITPENFTFLLAENSGNCLILQNAFERYFKILQQNTISQATVRRLKSFRANLTEGSNLGLITNITVNLNGECSDNDYPSLDINETYILNVTLSAVQLASSSIWGILRGLESFSQLLYLGSDGYTIRLNSTDIYDYPRYKHRGLLLDTSRHFIPLKQIYQIIDALEYNKMNVFHWHLVDDQSFPFVSQKFPELSQYGAYDPELYVYNTTDVQAVIEYARQRGIRVMPEIDTPGHTRSWGASHPEILTDCSAVQSGALGPLDPTKTETYTFLNDLLSEVRGVFKDAYIHLGGDEVGFECWENNEDIVKYMASNNISTYEDLESYYIQKIINSANSLKFNSIVWEEVFVNGVTLPNDTIVHVWRDYGNFKWVETMKSVTESNKPALLSACWYLDHLQTGGDWQGFYECDPTNFGGNEEEQNLVLGGEACMWTEVVNEYNVVQRIWPRASAPAEKLWSAYVDVSDGFDYTLTAQRLEEHVCRMNRRGIPAQPPNAAGYCL
ncbi:beta-hexosaminidase subunit alpha-like isoform X2 [Sitophilus oryzae]|uniref:Beta-hexosaminidase n=1 Tax=Sitophilus oryzae TaxID=7048 RepID=A0A6J2YGW3_SITOR|nr:beta-hexosaminidase subunit alpha-like isoform X2 [Sitophilus oryzae]